LHFNR